MGPRRRRSTSVQNGEEGSSRHTESVSECRGEVEVNPGLAGESRELDWT